jgi:hypothetical protein
MLLKSGDLEAKIIHFPVSQEIHPLPRRDDLIAGHAVFGQIAGKKCRTVIGWRCLRRTWLKPLDLRGTRFQH